MSVRSNITQAELLLVSMPQAFLDLLLAYEAEVEQNIESLKERKT